MSQLIACKSKDGIVLGAPNRCAGGTQGTGLGTHMAGADLAARSSGEGRGAGASNPYQF